GCRSSAYDRVSTSGEFQFCPPSRNARQKLIEADLHMNETSKSRGSRSTGNQGVISHQGTGGLRSNQWPRTLGRQWAHPVLFLAVVVPLSVGARVAQDFSEVHIGAFDADAWNGIVFESKAYGQRVPFAIRIGSKTDTFLDGNRIFDAVSLVGP